MALAERDEIQPPSVERVNLNAALTPFWQAVAGLAAQSNQLLDQSYQKLVEYGTNGSQYIGDKVQRGGKYLGDEIDANLKNALIRAYQGYRYVSDAVSNGVQQAQLGTAGGLRNSASLVGTIGDYRKAGLNKAANFAAIGAQRLNNILDNLNEYYRKEADSIATVIENPNARLNVGV